MSGMKPILSRKKKNKKQKTKNKTKQNKKQKNHRVDVHVNQGVIWHFFQVFWSFQVKIRFSYRYLDFEVFFLCFFFFSFLSLFFMM